MPIVTAAGYPTLQAPTIGPAPASELRGDYQRSDAATPEAFGAGVGRAEEQLGRSFEQVGTGLAQQATARQDFLNKTATDKAVNDYYDRTIALSYGDPNTPNDTGFMGKQGQDAVAQMPDFRNSLDSERNRIRATLTNPLQQLNFDNETRRQQAITLARAGEHFDRQLKADASATSQAKEANAYRSQTAAVAANDDPAWANGVRDAMNAALSSETALRGTLNVDQVNKVLDDVREKSVLAKVEGLRPTDPAAALQFLQLNRDAVPDTAKYAVKYHELYTQAVAQRAQDANYGVPAGQQRTPLPRGGMSIPGGAQSIQVPDQYKGLIDSATTQYPTVPSDLLTRVLHAESGFNPNAVSPTGARGIAQFIGSTARQYNIDPTKPEEAIPGAAHYLSDLYAKHGTWLGALTAYLGSDPRKDPSYIKSGAVQLAMSLDSGQAPAGGEQPTRTAAAAPGGGVEVWGDSLGVGLQRHLKGEGYAVGGATPTAIFNNIKQQPETYWQGKTIVLPSGSNGNQMPVVEDTIKYLQANGAKVIAVGYGPKFPEKNAALAEIAQRLNVPVVDAEGVGATEGVHPSPQGYQSMAQKIQAATAATAAPAAPQDTAQPPSPGAPRPIPAAAPGLPVEPASVVGSDGIVRPMPPHGENEGLDTQVPGLPERIQHLAETLPPPNTKENRDVWNAAIALARKDMNMAYANQQHAYRVNQEQQRALDDKMERDLTHRMFSPEGATMTAQQIENEMNGAGASAAATQRMIGFYERQTKPDPAAAVSRANTSKLFERIGREWGDPQKITDMKPVQQAFINQEITKSSYDFLEKQFNETKTVEGENLVKQKQRIGQMYKSSITKSNPLMGQLDEEGDVNFGRFETFVDQQVDQYKAQNKNPWELFNENSPNYVGLQVRRFQKTLQQSAADVANKIGKPNPAYVPPAGFGAGAPSATPGGAPSQTPPGSAPNRVPPRLPRETVEQYNKRIGAQ